MNLKWRILAQYTWILSLKIIFLDISKNQDARIRGYSYKGYYVEMTKNDHCWDLDNLFSHPTSMVLKWLNLFIHLDFPNLNWTSVGRLGDILKLSSWDLQGTKSVLGTSVYNVPKVQKDVLGRLCAYWNCLIIQLLDNCIYRHN